MQPYTIHNKPMGMICRPWRAWRGGAHVFRCCDIRNSDTGLVRSVRRSLLVNVFSNAMKVQVAFTISPSEGVCEDVS